MLNCDSFNILIWCFTKLHWKLKTLLGASFVVSQCYDENVIGCWRAFGLTLPFVASQIYGEMLLGVVLVVGWGWSAFEKSFINAWKLLWNYNIITIIIINDIITSLLWFWIFDNIILRCFQCYLQTQKHKEYRQKINSHYQVCSN